MGEYFGKYYDSRGRCSVTTISLKKHLYSIERSSKDQALIQKDYATRSEIGYAGNLTLCDDPGDRSGEYC